MSGWVKLHRKIVEWEWFTDKNTAHLFTYLVLAVNREDKTWRGVPCNRGQIITSRAKLAEKTGLSEQEVRTSLNRLKSTNDITSKSTNARTVITVCNYDKYQMCQDIEQPTSQPTSQPASQPQHKKKEERSKYSDRFEAFWREYPNKKGKHKAFLSWKKHNCENGIFNEVMKALSQQKDSKEWAKENGKYIPHASTWVNGRRWEDEIENNEPEWI